MSSLAATFRGRPSGEAPAGEFGALALAFLLFFLLFASYFMLRPVRETMGIAGGVDNLQWLFLATFLATLAVVPVYGALSARVPRRRLLPLSYTFVAATLIGFGAAMQWVGGVWTGRLFYVWLSVLNLFVISLAWSLMTDVFSPDQAKRLFGRIAAGASLGGLAGPLAGGLLVGTLGHAGLMLLSAALLIATLPCAQRLIRWRAASGEPFGSGDDPSRAIGGGIFAGLTLLVRSPYLMGIGLFVILLSAVSTFLYFEQARVVAAAVPDPVAQTRLFSGIDATVQALTILVQILATGRIARSLGVTALLVAVPAAMVLGFGLLATVPALPILVGVVVLRRVGEYAIARPGREMLFTRVGQGTRYKAKNAIDTVVYRGGDAISAWLNTAVAAAGAPVLLLGAGLAGLWALVGLALGRRHEGEDRRQAALTIGEAA